MTERAKLVRIGGVLKIFGVFSWSELVISTRVLFFRAGDKAPMAYIELVDRPAAEEAAE